MTAAVVNPSHGTKGSRRLEKGAGVHFIDGLLTGIAIAAAILFVASLLVA